MTCYERGEKVLWRSWVSGEASGAVFVQHDEDFPKEDVILAIRIGSMTHAFRWPLEYVEDYDPAQVTKTVVRRQKTRRRRKHER